MQCHFQINFVYVKRLDSPGITLRLKPATELVFSIDIFFQGTNGSLTIFLEDRDKSLVYPISFTCSSILIDVQQNTSINSKNFVTY